MFDLYIRSVAAHRQLNTASHYGQSSTRAANRVTHGSTIRPSRTAVCRTQNTGKLKPTSDRSRHTPQIRFSVAGEPHQLRSRNDLIKTQRTRSDAVENAAKSTKPTVILPLITVWLQVRVLSEPTTESIAGQSPVCGHGGLSPQVSVPSSSERAACISPNAEKFDNQQPRAASSFCSPLAPDPTICKPRSPLGRPVLRRLWAVACLVGRSCAVAGAT
jgi:hypothetical protein